LADNHLRFGLCRALRPCSHRRRRWLAAAGAACKRLQTALAGAYLAHTQRQPVVFVQTIHNLAYQGVFPQGVLGDLALTAIRVFDRRL
jgi:hypothetical protein